jgi:hypothetical protein
MLGGVGRSLLSAWTPRPDGPGWAPWAWTAAINTLVALALTQFVPRTGGFGANLLVSHSIGFTIHALFAGLGHGLRFDMFTLPGTLRAAYVVSVVLAGSWLGYAGATWLRLGDAGLVAAHLGRASVSLAIRRSGAAHDAAFAGVNRLRGQQRRGSASAERRRAARTDRGAPAVAQRPDRAALPLQHAGGRQRADAGGPFWAQRCWTRWSATFVLRRATCPLRS